jgi:hypothetical protein
MPSAPHVSSFTLIIVISISDGVTGEETGFYELSGLLLVPAHQNVTCMSDSRLGFGLEIGFIDDFNTQLVITLNYSVIADLHTLQITTTHILMSSVCYNL